MRHINMCVKIVVSRFLAATISNEITDRAFNRFQHGTAWLEHTPGCGWPIGMAIKPNFSFRLVKIGDFNFVFFCLVSVCFRYHRHIRKFQQRLC